jgi:hypothetical protein
MGRMESGSRRLPDRGCAARGSTSTLHFLHQFALSLHPAGSHLLALLRDVHMLVITTLHTVLREPNTDQRALMKQLDELSSRFIVMADRRKGFLEEIYGIAPEKIDVIPHGIPDMPFIDPNFNKDQFGVEGKTVLLTCGLLSPNKESSTSLKPFRRFSNNIPTWFISFSAQPTPMSSHAKASRIGSSWSASRKIAGWRLTSSFTIAL